MVGSHRAPARRRFARPALRRLGRFARACATAPKRLLGVAAAIGVGVLVASGLTAGSYAFLNAQATVGSAATISSGSAALTLTAGGGTPGAVIDVTAANWQHLLPGDVAGQTITVADMGDVPLAVTARTAAASALQIRIATGACPAGALPSTPLTTAPVAWSTLKKGESATMCIQATLPTTAPNDLQGKPLDVSVVLDATQVQP